MAILRLILVLAVCFFSAAAAAAAPAPAPAPGLGLIKQICGSTAYSELCVNALLRFPESQSADPHNLAELAIRAAAQVGTNYSGYIATFRSTGEDCVEYCGEEYEDAIGQLDDSTGLMENKQYEEVKKQLGAAIAAIETCEGECQAAALPDKVTFSEKNVEFRNLCGVVLSIVNLLNQ